MHSDLGRCVFVTLSGVLCIVGTLVGVGVIGTSVANTAGGALDTDALDHRPGSGSQPGHPGTRHPRGTRA